MKVHLTRHAFERYLERRHGVDVEAIKRRITDAAQAAHDVGASAVTIDGLRFPITENGAIVSALPAAVISRIPKKEPTHGRRDTRNIFRGADRRDRRPDRRSNNSEEDGDS